MDEVRTNLRLPGELYEAIKCLATEDLRSVNAEMTILLREAVAAREAKNQPRGVTLRPAADKKMITIPITTIEERGADQQHDEE